MDGRRSHLEGELQRFPAPAPWPWLAIFAAVLAVGAAPLLLRRRDLAGPAATGFAVAAATASMVTLLAFSLDAYASPGTWIEAVDAAAFLGVGVWAVFRAPEQWRPAGAIGVGLVAVAVGLLEGAVFLHPIVLAVFPAAGIRLACVVAIGAGVDAAALGGLVFAQTDMLGAARAMSVASSRPPWRSEQDRGAGDER